MKFCLIPTVEGVLEALADRERSVTSRLKLARYRELAANRIMELLGESAEAANPDKRPKQWPVSLGAAELEHSDDKHTIASSVLDPATLDWDRQHKIELPVERFGFRTVQTGKIVSDGTRQEPLRTKLLMAWQAEIELWPSGDRDATPATLTDRRDTTPPPLPAVNRKGEVIAPPAAILAEPQTAAAAIEKLMATTLPRLPQSVVVAADDLLLGDSLPVGSCRRIAGCLYLRHSADVCEVIYR